MKRCVRCLYPTTKVDLHFNEEGVCSACTSYDKRAETDWQARELDLAEIILKAKRSSAGYDCVIPSSGGKDSYWQVHKALELGLHPLIVTASTCHLTEIGRKNIDNLATYATTIEVTPNKKTRRRLNKIGLLELGDISWPEHVLIITAPFQIAKRYNIPLIFYGECPQAAYGGPPGSDKAYVMTERWRAEYGGFLGLRPSDLTRFHVGRLDIIDYQLPLDLSGVKAYWLGQFFEWDSRRNAKVAKSMGMRSRRPSMANWWDFENLDNAQTGIHDYFMWLKYGYGRACAQLSVDIRTGHMTREKATEKLEAHDDYPDLYMGIQLDNILKPIGVSATEWSAAEERFHAQA